MICLFLITLFFGVIMRAQDNKPVALNDNYSTGINDTLIVSAPGVLGNDFDDAVNAVKINDPAHGSVKLNTDGSFAYFPAPGFAGRDSFTYEANNGHNQSNMATVTIYIHTKATGYKNLMDKKVNAVPVATADRRIVEEDKPHHEPAPGILRNDNDPDSISGALTAELIRDAKHGELNLNADGSFDYTPEKNFFGIDCFTYRPYDETYYGSEIRVEIKVNNVNDAPVVVDEAFSTPVNTTLTGDLLANDYDVDKDRIKISPVKKASTEQDGTITIRSNGKFSYNPPEDFTGTDQYDYKVSDNAAPALNGSGTVYISVIDGMELNTSLTHNTCHGDHAGAIVLTVTDSTPCTQALSFNGKNDDVIIQDDPSLNMSGALTLEAWIRTTQQKEDILQVMGKEGHYGLRYEGNELIFYAGNRELIDTIHITDNVWYHFAATYNRHRMRLYVNGKEVASQPNRQAIWREGSAAFHIAQDNSGKRQFKGMIDEVRVWSIARKEEQIRKNMLKELYGNETGLEGYWKFNEGSGFIAYDASPNQNNGSLSLPDWRSNYDYSWRGPNGFSSEQEDISNLKAGEYTCMVKGSNGITSRVTASIREPEPLNLIQVDSAHQNPTTFQGGDGGFVVDPSGGSGIYEFSLDSGATWVSDSVFTGLPAGDYTVYLRDANDTSCQYNNLDPIHLNQPSVFNDCDSLKENNYCYRFWDESYNKMDSIPVRYEWSFSDGTKIPGLEVEHCFPDTGKYSVELNMIDNRTGNIFFTQKHYEFEIKNAIQPYIRSKDAFIKGKEIEFDGLKTNLPGFNIDKYYWDFGEDTSAEGPVVQHTYEEKGKYRVMLGLTGKSDTTGMRDNHCVWKEVRVFEDYQALAMYQEKKEGKINPATDPETEPNDELQTEFNAYERNSRKEIYRVEVLSSKQKVSLQDSVFDPLRNTYRISEFYDESDGLYNYTVGKKESLPGIYPIYNDVVERGFEEARVKSYIMAELPEEVVNQINQAFSKIDNARFGFDEYKVAKSSYPILDRIINIMKHNSDIKIEIAAHTDNIGSFEYNMELSRKRAQSIMDYMVSRGISQDRLKAVGYGESRPIASNQTEEGRQKNRRVEFILIKE